jgi:hypothetical protein
MFDNLGRMDRSSHLEVDKYMFRGMLGLLGCRLDRAVPLMPCPWKQCKPVS